MFSLLNLHPVKYKTTYFFAFLTTLCLSLQAKAQTDDTKKLYNFVQQEVERYENLLKLEYWQVFYADSVLTHNYTAMQEELQGLSRVKVANEDIYQASQDKWMEATYNAFHQFLTPEQWAKYLKSGAARDKKARDKRAAGK